MKKRLPIFLLTSAIGTTVSAGDAVDNRTRKSDQTVAGENVDKNNVLELEEMVITAPLRKKAADIALPVTVLKGNELIMKIGRSIGETLKDEPGITSQSFGPGVGTPVIRGQAGPRVRVLNNGIGSNDVSQLSPDHATSVEAILVDRIEVLRGPATLLYGSGAIGGVVNVIDNRIPGRLFSKLLGGALEQRFDSAANESTTAMKVEGSKGSLAYHLDGFFRTRGNLSIGGHGIDVNAAQAMDPSLTVVQNPKGHIPNTSAHAISGSAGVSLVGDPGFAGVSINRLENNYGIPPDGSGGSNTRIDLKQTKYDFKSELIDPLPFVEALRTRLGYTDYKHTELTGLSGEPLAPGTAFANKTYEGRAELTHRPIGPFYGTIGFQATASNFAAFNFELGNSKTIVPKSLINSYGVFAVESFDYGPVSYQLGGRVEQTSINPQGQNSLPGAPLAPSSLNYTPTSASVSALWKLNERHKINLGGTRSQRAPQVQELLSFGFHDATRSFDEGNASLKMETSYNLDVGYKLNTGWIRAEFDFFNNWVNNYIYQQRTGTDVFQDEVSGGPLACNGSQPADASCQAVLQSRQADAVFWGYESKLIFPLLRNLYGLVDLTLFSDYTRGRFSSGGDVPRMPPLRFGFQLDHTRNQWTSNLRLTRGEAQNHPGLNETATHGYVLLNLSTQYRIKTYRGVEMMIFAKANNLLNENIRNSVSYLRNFSPEPGRSAQVGIRLTF
ncbi:TonB-dependent receptor [Nitrosovibrio tenuis]|nr:TonB-dependent receptor [Nitrosovibrio tenuis]